MEENTNIIEQQATTEAALEQQPGQQTATEPETDKDGFSAPAGKPDRAYTPLEVDQIVRSRLARERNKIARMLDNDPRAEELAAREQAITTRELRADAREALAADNLPGSLADLLNYESRDSFDHSYETLKNSFNAAIQVGVKMALAGPTPRTGSFSPKDSIAAAFRRKE